MDLQAIPLKVTELDGAGSDVETKFLTRSASNFGFVI